MCKIITQFLTDDLITQFLTDDSLRKITFIGSTKRKTICVHRLHWTHDVRYGKESHLHWIQIWRLKTALHTGSFKIHTHTLLYVSIFFRFPFNYLLLLIRKQCNGVQTFHVLRKLYIKKYVYKIENDCKYFRC